MKSKSTSRNSDDDQDLQNLRTAVKRNGKKPGVPWEEVKKELGIDSVVSKLRLGKREKTRKRAV